MKPGSFLLLTLLLLYSNIAAQKINVKEYCKDYPIYSCTLVYRPVCGSDGKIYINKCIFCNEYIESGRRLQMTNFEECVKFEDAED